MQAVIYCRVSTQTAECTVCRHQFEPKADVLICPKCQAPGKSLQSTDNQLTILRTWAKSLDYTIVREYVDRASGKSGDRPEFQRLLKDSESGLKRFSLLLFYSLDRLSREGALPTLQYLQRFTNNGVGWKSYTENYLDSIGPLSDAIVAIMAVLAKQERIRISERTKAGLQRVKEKGSRSGKAIGRPQADFDEDEAREMLKTKSALGVAKELGIPISTLRTRIYGRTKKAPMMTWSDPVWGIVTQEGGFEQKSGGKIVVRFELGSHEAWCINHQQRIMDCAILHTQEETN